MQASYAISVNSDAHSTIQKVVGRETEWNSAKSWPSFFIWFEELCTLALSDKHMENNNAFQAIKQTKKMPSFISCTLIFLLLSIPVFGQKSYFI